MIFKYVNKHYFIQLEKNFSGNLIFMIQFYFSIFLLVVLTFFALLLDAPELTSLIQTF